MAAENAQMAKIYEDKRGSLRDTFGLVASKQAPPHQQSNMSNIVNVVITDVAWSKPQRYNHRDNNTNAPEMMDDNHQDSTGRAPATHKRQETTTLDSIVAAAGSNGVVVVWSARRAFLEGDGSANSMANQQPEAILSQHSRAVNRLAWHPKRPGLLLTASQVRFQSSQFISRYSFRATQWETFTSVITPGRNSEALDSASCASKAHAREFESIEIMVSI